MWTQDSQKPWANEDLEEYINMGWEFTFLQISYGCKGFIFFIVQNPFFWV